jgi:hypothetical protein
MATDDKFLCKVWYGHGTHAGGGSRRENQPEVQP